MLNELYLNCFLTLADTLSFTRTSELLYITQQAVSSRILKLEEELGFPLFTRSTRSVALTEAGRAYYQYVLKMQSDYGDMVNRLKTAANHAGTAVHIGYITNLDIFDRLQACIRDHTAKNPGVTFEAETFDAIELIRRLESGRLDLIFTFEHLIRGMAGLAHRVVLSGPTLILYAAGSPLEGAADMEAAFKKAHFIFGNLGGSTSDETIVRIRQHSADCGFPDIKYSIVSNLASMEAAIKMGRGVTFCSGYNKMTQNPQLRQYALKTPTNVVAAWREADGGGVAAVFADRFGKAQSARSGSGGAQNPDV